MKLLIFSDSHGDSYAMANAIRSERDTDAVIFLGDGWRDAADIREEFPRLPFYSVKGNCDLTPEDIPLSDTLTLEGVKIFFCHGHAYGVKYGTERLEAAARQAGADIALYGHTHEPSDVYLPAPPDGKPLRLLNPGSVGGYGHPFAVIRFGAGQGIYTELRRS